MPVPGVLREANVETHTASKPTWFFSAKAVILSKCSDTTLMKEMQLLRNKSQEGEIADTWLHFQQKAG